MVKNTKPSPLFKRLKESMEEAIAWVEGDPNINVRVHHFHAMPEQSRNARAKLKLSQAEFAKRFGLSVATIRNWEQGRRVPETSSRILLSIIDKYPHIVDEVLASKP